MLALWQEAPPASQACWDEVESWFGTMSRKVWRGGNFKNGVELGEAIQAFIAAYHPKTKPFKWRKREPVKDMTR